MTTFPFQIITPTGPIIRGDITHIKVRTYDGALGVMARHAPMVAACPPGIVSIQQEGVWINFKTDAALLTANGISVDLLTTDAEYVADNVLPEL